MSDNYQAVYDAIRSKFHMPNISELLFQSFDISWPVETVKNEYLYAAQAQQRPSVLFKPKIYIDGNMWCALYGDDLQNGVAGFGKSPDAAIADFDKAWHKELGAK